MSDQPDLSAVLSSIESSSKRLNTVSNNSNAVLRNIEHRLQSANIGLDVWCDEQPLERTNSTDLAYDETAVWRTQSLGFARVADDWCFAVRTMRNAVFFFEGEELRRDAVDGGPSPLLRASRNLRLAAMRVMPEFLAFLSKEIDAATENLDSATSVLTKAKK